MSYPIIALSVEGISDTRFLVPLVRRLVIDIFLAHNESVPQPDIELIDVPKDPDRVLHAALLATHHDILIVHADCDTRSLLETRQQLFEPGKDKVEALRPVSTQPLPELVALLPKHEIEAWILADTEVFLNVLLKESGTSKNKQELKLPAHITEAETMASPKERLKEIVRLSVEHSPRRKRDKLKSVVEQVLYIEIADYVRLTVLEQLESYRIFKEELTDALRKLNYIR
jgi:hypothetical protein